MKLDAGEVKGMKCNVCYAVAQLPTAKDEDMWRMYDQNSDHLGDMAGACFMLFDGHGGKAAAQICCDQLLSHLRTAHETSSGTLQATTNGEQGAAPADDRSDLKSRIMDRNSWMGYMMDSAIEASFNALDVKAKKESNAGTTASILLIRDDPLDDTELASPEPCVIVKCAWVGDSRCTRGDLGQGGWEICEDVSRDHRPEAESELARLSQSTHGRMNVNQPMVVVPGPNLSVRGPRGELQDISVKFEKLTEEMEPHGGFQVCYDTPGFPVESSVHGTRSRGNMRQSWSSHSLHGKPGMQRVSSRDLKAAQAISKTHSGEITCSSEDERGSPMGAPPNPDLPAEEGKGKEPEVSKPIAPADSAENAFFIGRLAAGGAMSQLRVFYPSGSSTAFTRSIGDRDTGGVNISKPEINSIEAALKPGSRFIVASDGMWDVITTPAAHKMCKNLPASKAASKLALEAQNKRKYSGLAPDDITVMVVDVSANPMSSTKAVTVPASAAARSVGGESSEDPGTGAFCGCFGMKRSASAPAV